MKKLSACAGRQWPADVLDDSIKGQVVAIPAIQAEICQRCGTRASEKLPGGVLYCRACIGLGRLDAGQLLLRCPAQNDFPKQGGLIWQGQLQPRQEAVSQALLQAYQDRRDILVHAVTGAGKTEMIFPLLAAALAEGSRICLATPRIDVVNELYPRLSAAFAVTIGKYHGREEKEAANEQLVLATTHQLLKYYQAFDLLIIDEVDSFPYAGSPQLHFAAGNAVKPTGSRVFLTATPTSDLLAEVKKGNLAIVKLNRRFHGGLLPVPLLDFYIAPFISKGRLHPKLARQLVKAVKAGHPLLVFVPRIAEIPAYLAAIKAIKDLDQVRLAGVHAQDPDRLEKVEAFRKGELDLLLTTTILERGVTFKHVWVIIIAADDAIYPPASLVQIAGRVGRAKDDQTGLVLFCYHKYTRAMREAIGQIKEMNRG